MACAAQTIASLPRRVKQRHVALPSPAAIQAAVWVEGVLEGRERLTEGQGDDIRWDERQGSLEQPHGNRREFRIGQVRRDHDRADLQACPQEERTSQQTLANANNSTPKTIDHTQPGQDGHRPEEDRQRRSRDENHREQARVHGQHDQRIVSGQAEPRERWSRVPPSDDDGAGQPQEERALTEQPAAKRMEGRERDERA